MNVRSNVRTPWGGVGEVFEVDALTENQQWHVKQGNLTVLDDDEADEAVIEAQTESVTAATEESADLSAAAHEGEPAAIVEPEPDLDPPPVATQYDPANYTVDEVNEYLGTLSEDDPEMARVLQAEADGKARKGILGE